LFSELVRYVCMAVSHFFISLYGGVIVLCCSLYASLSYVGSSVVAYFRISLVMSLGVDCGMSLGMFVARSLYLSFARSLLLYSYSC